VFLIRIIKKKVYGLKKSKKSVKHEANVFVISIIAILAIALIGINIDKITGNATNVPSFSQKTTISIPLNEKFINAGDYIHMSITPGPKCVNRIVGVYDEYEFRRATVQPSSAEFGSNKKLCNPFTVKFKTYSEWTPNEDESGIFFVKVFDYETEGFVTTTFTIR